MCHPCVHVCVHCHRHIVIVLLDWTWYPCVIYYTENVQWVQGVEQRKSARMAMTKRKHYYEFGNVSIFIPRMHLLCHQIHHNCVGLFYFRDVAACQW